MDRWNRKTVMIVADIGRAFCLLSIPIAIVLGHLTMVQLYIASAIQGTFLVFFDIAEGASLPSIVRKDQIATALATNNAVTTSLTVMGPPVGGFLFQLGRGFPFLADAISYVVSSCSLMLMRAKTQQQREASSMNLRQEIFQGIIWLWKHPLMRFLAVFNAVYFFVVFPGGQLVAIVFAQRQFQASAAVIGLIFTMAELGRLPGTFLVPSVEKRVRPGLIVVFSGFLTVLLVLLLLVSPNVWFLGVMIAAQYLIAAIYDAVVFGYQLGLIPDELQGRVNSVIRLITFGFQSLGVLATGLLLQVFGVFTTLTIFACGLVVFTIGAMLNATVRNARSAYETSLLDKKA